MELTEEFYKKRIISLQIVIIVLFFIAAILLCIRGTEHHKAEHAPINTEYHYLKTDVMSEAT